MVQFTIPTPFHSLVQVQVRGLAAPFRGVSREGFHTGLTRV